MSLKYGYIGYSPDTSPVVVAKQVFSPTGVQTNFTFAAGYQIGYLDVYLNGARQIEGQDFSATDTSTVGLSSAAQSGDILELVAYKAYNLAAPSAVGNFTVSGNLTVNGTTTLSAGSSVSFATTAFNLIGIASTATAAATAYGLSGNPNITVGNINTTGIITASSFIGGISSVTQLSVSGISTLGNIQISSGIVTTTASYLELYKPVLSNYSEKINVIGNTGSSCNINLANGAYVTATLNQTTTFTFTTGITVGALGFALQLTNGSGGPYTITWPASVKWPNNAIPTRTTTDSKTDVWVFNSTDNGTNWYGNLALYNFS
jgi:hypothetical protein